MCEDIQLFSENLITILNINDIYTAKNALDILLLKKKIYIKLQKKM